MYQKGEGVQSEQIGDLRGATILEGRVRVTKSERSFEQKSEQKREREVAAVAIRVIVPAFGIVQVWVEVRTSELGRHEGAGS